MGSLPVLSSPAATNLWGEWELLKLERKLEACGRLESPPHPTLVAHVPHCGRLESPHTPHTPPTFVAAAVRKLIPKAGPDPNQMKLPICLSTEKFAECPTSQLSICAADNGHCYRWSASWFTANICETQIKSTLGWKMPLHKCPGELNQGAE